MRPEARHFSSRWIRKCWWGMWLANVFIYFNRSFESWVFSVVSSLDQSCKIMGLNPLCLFLCVVAHVLQTVKWQQFSTVVLSLCDCTHQTRMMVSCAVLPEGSKVTHIQQRLLTLAFANGEFPTVPEYLLKLVSKNSETFFLYFGQINKCTSQLTTHIF